MHTHIRGSDGESIAHDCHPIIGLVHILKSAPIQSEVFISIPFLTVWHVIDQLAHYAKPPLEQGRGLVVKGILGPEPSNVEAFQSYIRGKREGEGKKMAIYNDF